VWPSWRLAKINAIVMLDSVSWALSHVCRISCLCSRFPRPKEWDDTKDDNNIITIITTMTMTITMMMMTL